MIDFAYPGYLYASLLLPLAFWAIWRILVRSKKLINIAYFSLPATFGKLAKLKFFLRIAALFLLFLVLLGPYRSDSSDTQTLLGREIYILLDISASMNTQDISPSRLHKAKRLIRQMVRKLQGDKMGLIVFSDDAFLQCPLTRDFELFETLLDLTQSRQFSRSGTQFRPALSLALDHLIAQRKLEMERNQAVILLSDGEDYGDAYPSILDRYRKNRIKLFTIGLGTTVGGPIPQNNSQEFMKNPQGQPFISTLKDSTLKALARTAKTKYLAVSDLQVSPEPILEQIESTLVAPLDKKRLQAESSLVSPILLLALLFLMVNAFLLPQISSQKTHPLAS